MGTKAVEQGLMVLCASCQGEVSQAKLQADGVFSCHFQFGDAFAHLHESSRHLIKKYCSKAWLDHWMKVTNVETLKQEIHFLNKTLLREDPIMPTKGASINHTWEGILISCEA